MQQLQSVNPYAAPTSVVDGAIGSVFCPSWPLTKLEYTNHWLTRFRFSFSLSVLAFIGMILFAEYPYSAYVFLIARISTWVVAVILAKNNYNWGNALIVAVLYPIPLVSIVVYLSVRDETRRVLKLHGYQPGWPKYVLSEEAARRIEAGFDLNAEKKKLRRSVLDLCMTYGLILILGLMLAGVYATYP